MACNGECCTGFTLIVDSEPLTHESWRLGDFASGDLATLAIPAAEDRHFNCVNFDSETRLCKDYANRPQTCRDYPWQSIQKGQLTDTCQHCGDIANSSSE